jgi:hypothetical protein
MIGDTVMDMIKATITIGALTRDQVGLIAVKVGTMIKAIVGARTGMIGLHQCAVFTRQ